MNENDANVIKLDHEVFDREIKVWQYRVAGATFEQIAEKLGYANESGARAAFKRYVNRTKDETLANEIRDLHRQRLEIALLAIWPAVERGDLESIKVMLKILERDAKLFGIDMPVKTEVEVTTYDGIYLRESTERLINQIREIETAESFVGEGTSETGTVTE
jgi:hypothetical protein